MSSIFLDEYPSHSYLDLALFPIVPYRFVYAHYKKEELKHYIVAVVEAILIVGALIALLEYLIAKIILAFQVIKCFFQSIAKETTNKETAELNKKVTNRVQEIFFELEKKEKTLEEEILKKIPLPFCGSEKRLELAWKDWVDGKIAVFTRFESSSLALKKELIEFFSEIKSINQEPFLQDFDEKTKKLLEKLNFSIEIDHQIAFENFQKAEKRLYELEEEAKKKIKEKESFEAAIQDFKKDLEEVMLNKENFLKEAAKEIDTFLNQSLEKIKEGQKATTENIQETLGNNYNLVKEKLDPLFLKHIQAFKSKQQDISKIEKDHKALLHREIGSLDVLVYRLEKVIREALFELESLSKNYLNEATSTILEKLKFLEISK